MGKSAQLLAALLAAPVLWAGASCATKSEGAETESGQAESGSSSSDGESGSIGSDGVSGGTGDPICQEVSEAAFDVQIASEFDAEDDTRSFRAGIPCSLIEADAATLTLDCMLDGAAGTVVISAPFQGDIEAALLGLELSLAYSWSEDGPLVDAWRWFSIFGPSETLIIAGGAGGFILSEDPFAPMSVQYLNDVCEESVNEGGPCGPYVRGAVRLVVGDSETTILDRTTASFGAWQVKAGEIFLQSNTADSCDGGTQGSRAQWLLEPL